MCRSLSQRESEAGISVVGAHKGSNEEREEDAHSVVFLEFVVFLVVLEHVLIVEFVEHVVPWALWESVRCLVLVLHGLFLQDGIPKEVLMAGYLGQGAVAR